MHYGSCSRTNHRQRRKETDMAQPQTRGDTNIQQATPAVRNDDVDNGDLADADADRHAVHATSMGSEGYDHAKRAETFAGAAQQQPDHKGSQTVNRPDQWTGGRDKADKDKADKQVTQQRMACRATGLGSRS